MSEPRGLVLQQYAPRLTDRGLEAVGGANTLAPLSQIAKMGRAAYADSCGWFRGPVVVVGGWVSGLVTTFVRPSQAGASKRSRCDVWLRPRPFATELREHIYWVVVQVRAWVFQDPRLALYTGRLGVVQSGRYGPLHHVEAHRLGALLG
jgi:hypothetical protein